ALDAGQLQLLPEDGGQLLQRDVPLQGVIALALAGLVSVARLYRARAQLLPHLAVALPDAPLLLVPVLEVGNVDEGNGDGDGVLPPLAQHLALLHVPSQIGFDLSADDLFEARVVLVDLQRHRYSLASPRAKMLAPKLRNSVEQISQ